MSDISDLDGRVAVVGMAARFPGARDLAGFWRNLVSGTDSVTSLAAPEGARHQPAFGLLDQPDFFDAEFFGYAPREALTIDPQHRVFMECAWAALEHAGYDPSRYPGAIGVYAGCSQTGYAALLHDRRESPLLADIGDYELRLGSGIDFLTTRTAHKLGLRGPAVTVQTACSTSLVAIHLAAQGLLAGDCDMALAGGVSVHVPVYTGVFSASGIISAAGRCRAFDAAADGTVGGNGAGVVLLKRLPDALADGDTVHAVILGSAVNNDAGDKVGFTAPSVRGQSAAVATALRLADVPADTVTYVEAHGTGTPLGDPVEIAALAAAFGNTDAPTCWIGSVKTNIGHTDAAAGVAGFIKTVLALSHRTLPPSLHFQQANPDIDFAATRFAVNTETRPWTTPAPLRASVNSLGLGGTNAHVVLEEAPAAQAARQVRSWRLVPLSGRTRAALDTAAGDLAEHLAEHPGADPGALAWTLQTGRRHHALRSYFVVEDAAALRDALAAPRGAAPSNLAADGAADQPLVFLFPGQGGQRIGMTRALYAQERTLRDAVDSCARLFLPWLGVDLRDILYAAPGDPAAAKRLTAMSTAQACMFAVEYALARLLLRWGAAPDAVAGHSLGAYAAACVAGVFDLDDAVTLVASRGRLLESLPPGAMIAVALPEGELRTLIGPGLDIAAVNGPAQCVVSGGADAVRAFGGDLARDGVDVRWLRISAGAHSSLVDAVVEPFHDVAAALRLNAPSIPVVSDHTGTWLTAHEARDPAYWAAHLRGTVRFADLLTTLLDAPGRPALLEVGPGRTLTTLARGHPAPSPAGLLLTSLPHADDDEPEAAHLLDTAGRLWQSGRDLDWAALNEGERHRRVPLPTYPFQRLRLHVEADPAVPVAIESALDDTDPDDEDAYVAPLGATQTAVAAAFERILGTVRVGAQDSFLTLGGDSLIGARLTAWIRLEYGAALTLREVFKSPTVAALAARIDALAPAGASRIPLEVDSAR